MYLAELLQDICPVTAEWDRVITGLSQDSRQLQPGNLFFAYPGTQLDGRQFIAEAVTKGTAAVLLEPGLDLPGVMGTIPMLAIPRLHEWLGLVASRFYRNPSQQMKLIGITGTSGKTSCSHFLAACLQAIRRPCGIIGSVGNGCYGQLQPSHLTTPDAIELQSLLAAFQAQGLQYVSIEVSSHRLAQRRFQHLPFTVAVFTNLSRDHLDYHNDMASYAQAKYSLFSLPYVQAAVLNVDDPYGATWSTELASRLPVYAYSLNQPKPQLSHIPHSYVQSVTLATQGLKAYVHTPWGEGWLQNPYLIGQFNLSNILAVLTVLGLLEVPWSQMMQSVAQLHGIVGRMECFGGGHQPLVVVDYAHKPAPLQLVLQTLRQRCRAKLWCVFGCGGNKDRGRRPAMGQIAEQEADYCIITNDNPRLENPKQIFADILRGFTYPNRVMVEPDRRRAIAYAISHAQAEDIVLLAGKGHECYQIVGEERQPFSDHDEVKRCLAKSNKV